MDTPSAPTPLAALKGEWTSGLTALKTEWAAECRRADTPGLLSFASAFTAITAVAWLLWGSGGVHDSALASLGASTASLRAALANLFGWTR